MDYRHCCSLLLLLWTCSILPGEFNGKGAGLPGAGMQAVQPWCFLRAVRVRVYVLDSVLLHATDVLPDGAQEETGQCEDSCWWPGQLCKVYVCLMCTAFQHPSSEANMTGKRCWIARHIFTNISANCHLRCYGFFFSNNCWKVQSGSHFLESSVGFITLLLEHLGFKLVSESWKTYTHSKKVTKFTTATRDQEKQQKIREMYKPSTFSLRESSTRWEYFGIVWLFPPDYMGVKFPMPAN